MSTLLHTAPLSKWGPTGNFTEDGKPMFSSREWTKGEKQAYIESNMRNLDYYQKEVNDEEEN